MPETVTSLAEVSLILPAFNEKRVIGSTLEAVVSYFESRNLSYEILVAADGTDGTREHVRELYPQNSCIKVLGSSERRGKGLSVKEAALLAQGKYIGYMDADHKTPISEFDKVYPELVRGTRVVIGSRAVEGANIEIRPALYRRIGSAGFRYLMWTITGLFGVKDTQCGFKFFENTTAKNLFGMQKVNGYMFDVELLCLAKALDISISQVPVRWRADGDSRLNLVRNNIQNVRDLIRISWRVRFESGPYLYIKKFFRTFLKSGISP